MFDIGWTEILILAVVSLFVIGPKDIPKFLGFIGKLIGKVRNITGEFRETVDDAIKNSELEEVRKEISFTDPELSKNFNEILNPSKENKNNKPKVDAEEIKDNEQNILRKNEPNDIEENTEYAGPTENLPTGLKHIREDALSNNKNLNKNEIDES
tara:strand:- start:30 stop:494 length:465 start_codon:yes stop_codon:yes gene_type:complete